MGLPFVVTVVDQRDDPAPCVALRTVDAQVFVTDTLGRVAIDEPGLMGDTVWLHVSSDAYEVAPDFFGYEGAALRLVPGDAGAIRVTRTGTAAPCGALPAAVDGFLEPPFDLQVVDEATGRGVPLVRVDGPGGPYWTDSAGHVAVREPSLEGAAATFTVASLDGYGPVAGPTTVDVVAGGAETVAVARSLPAERLYRVTGRGVYRDSVLLGLPTPTESPVIDGRVMGQDTVMVVPTDAGPLWLWGDTNRPDYPLGLFDMSGAIARPLADPEDGVDLDYFVDPATGFSRAMAPIPGDGPTWLAGPLLLEDGGLPVIAAVYGNFSADLSANERGVAVLDEATTTFVKDTAWPDPRLSVTINPPLVRAGTMWLKEGLRFPATLSAARDPTTWEVRTSRRPDGSVDTWPDGEPRPSWTPLPTAGPPEAADPLVDHLTGEEVRAHGDSIAWSPWRGRWHRVFTQDGGTSWLGEMWYAEADTPFGPWERAVRIATHTDYTSYNPYVHAELSGDGRRLLWEATYTAWLATDEPTPRYDYNQVMYALDLEDPRVNLPTPVYRGADGALATLADLHAADVDAEIAFLAPDRPFAGSVPIGPDGPACDGGAWVAGSPLLTVFYAAPADSNAVGTAPLVRATSGGAEGLFDAVPEGWTPTGEALGRVWSARRHHADLADWLPELRVDAGPDQCLREGDEWTWRVAPPAGGSVSVSLDGVAVSADAEGALVPGVGRHVVTVTVAGPGGAARDHALLAVAAEEPPRAHTGDPADPPVTDEPDPPPTKGCGCAGGPPAGVAALALVAPALRRRRHSVRTASNTIAAEITGSPSTVPSARLGASVRS